MPIASTDILYKYSVTTGAAGNSTAAGAAGTYLGKYISTTPIVDATLDNLFPDVTGDENAADNVDYQCIFVHNNHGTLSLQNAVVWISSQVSGGANAAIATDNIGVTNVGSSSAQAAVIGTKNTAPTGVSSFSAPTTKSGGLALGTIGPGQTAAIWIQRTATNSAALNNDGLTIRVEGDTAA
jgi:hypothetical protein